jgi:DNA invertase Pin-like site-specific DNA recombinase
MLKAASRGSFDVVMAWSLDRLGRDLRDLLNLSKELDAARVGLCLLKDSIDTTTASGRLYFHVMGALAEFERARLAERVRAGLARTKKRLGRPPIDSALHARIADLLESGMGMCRVASHLHTGSGTVQRIAKELRAATASRIASE